MVCHPNNCFVLNAFAQILQNPPFRKAVHRRASLVHEYDGAFLEQRTSNGYALCLAFAESATLFATGRVESLRALEDEIGCGKT